MNRTATTAFATAAFSAAAGHFLQLVFSLFFLRNNTGEPLASPLQQSVTERCQVPKKERKEAQRVGCERKEAFCWESF